MSTIRWEPSGRGPQNKWGGTIGWSWSFDATFHGEPNCRLTYRPKIQLLFEKGFTANEKRSFMRGSAAAVAAAFNRWKIVPKNVSSCEICSVGVDVNVRTKMVDTWTWTDDYEVQVFKRRDGSNMTNWYLGDQRFTAAHAYKGVVHEVGHMLGLDDEYLSDVYPNRTATDLPTDAAQSFMACRGSWSVLKRHMETITFDRAGVNSHLPCSPYNLVTR